MRLGLTIVLIILLQSYKSYGQFEISSNISKEIILDELKWVYNNGYNYTVILSKTDKYKHKRIAFGGIFSFGNFKPKQDIFYYLLPEYQFGTISYANYNQIQIGASLRRDFIIIKKMELFVGGEVGLQYINTSYLVDDPNSLEEIYIKETRVVISPKIGVSFIINKHISIFAQSKYYVSIGKGPNYNYFLSNGIGLNFRFE